MVGTADSDNVSYKLMQRNGDVRIEALIHPVDPDESGTRMHAGRNKVGDIVYFREVYGGSFPDNLGLPLMCDLETCAAIHELCEQGVLVDIAGPCGNNLIVREHPKTG